MRRGLTSFFRFCAAFVIAPGIMGLLAQSPNPPLVASAGPEAAKFVLKHFSINPLASDPNTHQPLRADGSWSLSKSRPESCPQTTETCVEVNYAVPAQSVKCSWVISLSDSGVDGNVLNENDDAGNYMVRTLSAGEAISFVKSRSKPVTPPIAVAARVSGIVITRVLVGKTGEVQHVWPVSGPPMLIPASLDAAKKWSFMPMTIGARTAQYQVQLVFTYYLPIDSMPTSPGAVKLAP